MDVTVLGDGSPASDEAEGDELVLQEAGGGVVDRFLQIQQAQVVLAAFADDNVGAALGGVGPDASNLGLNLALQVSSKSADPNRPFVFFSPDAGRGEITQGLAGASASFGQDEVGIAFGLARQEGGGRGTGVVCLPRPLLGMGAKDLGQAGTRLDFRDREGGGRRWDGGFLEL